MTKFLDKTTHLLLKYCKRAGAQRGLEYVTQIDSDSETIEGVTISTRLLMYVHTQFKTTHLRNMLHCKGKMVFSSY